MNDKKYYIQKLLDDLAETLADRQAKRETTYKTEYDPDNMKKYAKTSMAGLNSWLRREK